MTDNSNLQGSGWFAVPNAIFEAELDPYEIAILVNLYRRAGADGTSWPGKRRIAQDTGMSRPTARVRLDSLKGKGWIEITPRYREGTQRRESNLYTLRNPVQFRRGGKGDLPPVVNEVDHDGKGDLPGVVNEVYRKDDSVKDEPSKDEGPAPPSSLREKIQSRLSVNTQPKPKHLQALAELHEKHGDNLDDIITYALDEFFPRDSWMQGKPLNWGTVMHCLPDAAAAWQKSEQSKYQDLTHLIMDIEYDEREE